MKNTKLIFHEHGRPEEVLALETEEQAPPAAGRVLVRLRYAAINPAHLLAVRGKYGKLPPVPATPGTEASGVVEAVGAGVTDWKVGDRVTLLPNAMGNRGTWQTYLEMDPEHLFPTPASLDDQASGSVWINALTAWVGLKDIMKFEAGQTVVITASESQLSRALGAMVRHLGGHSLATSRRPVEGGQTDPFDGILVLEPELVEKGTREVSARLKQELAAYPEFKAGPHFVFDNVGDALGSALFSRLRPGGLFVVCAFLSGKPVEVFAPAIFKQLRLGGFWISHWLDTEEPAVIKKRMGEIAGLFETGVLPPRVDQAFDLSDFQSALAYLRANPRQGKVSLRLSPD